MDTSEQGVFKNRVDEADVEGHRSMAKADGGEGIIPRTQRFDEGEGVRAPAQDLDDERDVEGHRSMAKADGGEGIIPRTQRLEDEGDVEAHRQVARGGEDVLRRDADGDAVLRRAGDAGDTGEGARARALAAEDDVEGHLFRNGPTTQGEIRQL